MATNRKPTSASKKRKPRDYKKEYSDYHGKPEQIKKRSKRNCDRRKLNAKKGEEVHHTKGGKPVKMSIKTHKKTSSYGKKKSK
jgi:hypothetical protein